MVNCKMDNAHAYLGQIDVFRLFEQRLFVVAEHVYASRT